MFRARVYNVMIGCPSDITEEVKVVEDVIENWNRLHSQREGIVMLPLYWKYSSYPTAGVRPQESIDEQVVSKSDLLISIFGTRIGSPTGDELSGTIEEINLHVKTGRPVMVFFKNSVDLRQINMEQLSKLNQYRTDNHNNISWVDFGGSDEFKELFRDKLQLFINDKWSKEAKDDDLHDEELIREAERHMTNAIQECKWCSTIKALWLLFYALQLLLRCKDVLRASSSIDDTIELIDEIMEKNQKEGKNRVFVGQRDDYIELMEKVKHRKKDSIINLLKSAEEVPEDFDEMGDRLNIP